MGTFNFSNMQQQEDKMRNVPEEFRGAVEKAASEPVSSYSNNDDNEIDTNTGFLDETGTWNNGRGQELQKYNPTQKQFNNAAAVRWARVQVQVRRQAQRLAIASAAVSAWRRICMMR